MKRDPSLDGVRALACLGVVACHADAPGCKVLGALGVQAFFILSGYLITRILRDREPAYGSFLATRLRRLAPALGAMLLIASPLAIQNPLVLVVAGAWVMNWWQLFGRPIGAFGHTWSLGLEMQFYLAWPFIARRLPSWGAVPLAAIALVLWEAWLMAPVPYRGINPAGMLTGAALALRPIPWPVVLRRACAWPPLATLGLLSYGIYLWHVPALAILPPGPWQARLALCLGVSIGLSALSYLTIERWAGCAGAPLLPGRPGPERPPRATLSTGRG